MGREFLDKCDELWVFGKGISSGIFEEIEFARSKGIPIKRIIELDMETKELAPLRLGM